MRQGVRRSKGGNRMQEQHSPGLHIRAVDLVLHIQLLQIDAELDVRTEHMRTCYKQAGNLNNLAICICIYTL